MSTLSIIEKNSDLSRILAGLLGLSHGKTYEITYADERELQKVLYHTDFNVIILEKGCVKGQKRSIRGCELSRFLKIDRQKLLEINRKVCKKGIYIFKQRTSFFTKIEYHITGFWDYSCGL